MQSVVSLLATASRSQEDVQGLMKAVQVILRLSESRLDIGLTEARSEQEGSIRRLRDDLGQLHRLCITLAEMAMALSEPASAALSKAESLLSSDAEGSHETRSLRTALRDSEAELRAVTATAEAVRQRLIDTQDVLDEAVLRRDLPRGVRDEVANLIRRIR